TEVFDALCALFECTLCTFCGNLCTFSFSKKCTFCTISETFSLFDFPLIIKPLLINLSRISITPLRDIFMSSAMLFMLLLHHPYFLHSWLIISIKKYSDIDISNSFNTEYLRRAYNSCSPLFIFPSLNIDKTRPQVVVA